MTPSHDHCQPGERDLIEMLQRLSVPIVITAPGPSGGVYRWRCLGHQGTAVTLTRALEQALHFLIGRFTAPSGGSLIAPSHSHKEQPYDHDTNR